MSWVKLHRKITEWEWYDDPVVKAVFLDFVILANRYPTKYRGYDLERGSCICGISATSKRLGISEQQFKTALKKLISTGEISKKATNKFTIVKVCNYDDYQLDLDDVQQTNNKQTTNKQQTSNKPVTTPKESKNKESKNISFLLEKVEPKNVCLFFAKQSREWIDNAERTLRIGKDDAKLNSLVIDFQSHLISSGAVAETEKETKSHFLNWARKVLANERAKPNLNSRKDKISENIYSDQWK